MQEHAPAPAALLITGISGYVGGAVAAVAAAAGHRVTGTYLHHPPDRMVVPGCNTLRVAVEDIPALIGSLQPDAILHTAAAWRTEAEARAVIVEGTRGIAGAASRVGARLIHMSTDLVFDGEHGPYTEHSQTAPVNYYGAAKAEAERIVLDLSSGPVIARTSLVTCFHPPDPRTRPIVDALTGRGLPVTLFTDEYRCPVRVEDLAAALVELISLPFSGIMHIAGPERLSRYELGLRVARFYRLPNEPGIVPALARDSGQPRPRDCTLDISLARRVLQTPLRPLPQP